MARPRVACIVGTRPDTIKMAPVILELQRYSDRVEPLVLSTGQHREMLDQALGTFGIRADHDLEIMTHGQTLAEVTSRALVGLDRWLGEVQPQLIIAQGDTTTTFVASLAAFYRQIPFAHVEAGLRTPVINDPFPEEFNRRASSLVASHHYCPTEVNAEQLRLERVPSEVIFVTGNTGIDAVHYVAQHEPKEWFAEHSGRILMLTTHRRENWGAAQERISRAFRRILEAEPDLLGVVPMHRNPVVREVLERILGDHPRVRLIEPPAYAEFVKLMQVCRIILTDSGGIQEEAPAFGIPVLVLRETTERPEGVAVGTAKLVGADEAPSESEALTLLRDPAAYTKMAQATSPYGDGRAAPRIRYHALRLLGMESPEEKSWTPSKPSF